MSKHQRVEIEMTVITLKSSLGPCAPGDSPVLRGKPSLCSQTHHCISNTSEYILVSCDRFPRRLRSYEHYLCPSSLSTVLMIWLLDTGHWI